MEIVGYKCFNKNITNSYGLKFEIGKTYAVDGPIKFGTEGNGFHMCERLEDTLRYFDAMNEEVSICLVKGSGEILEWADEYYGYYDMYVVQRLEILKKLSRDEIIDNAIHMDREGFKRFLIGFKLSCVELLYFKNMYKKDDMVLRYIEYYQENQFDAFEKKKII